MCVRVCVCVCVCVCNTSVRAYVYANKTKGKGKYIENKVFIFMWISSRKTIGDMKFNFRFYQLGLQGVYAPGENSDAHNFGEDKNITTRN